MEQCFTRTASTTASILSAGVPSIKLEGHKRSRACDGRMFLGVSTVVATPNMKIIGTLIIHSLKKMMKKMKAVAYHLSKTHYYTLK